MQIRLQKPASFRTHFTQGEVTRFSLTLQTPITVVGAGPTLGRQANSCQESAEPSLTESSKPCRSEPGAASMLECCPSLGALGAAPGRTAPFEAHVQAKLLQIWAWASNRCHITPCLSLNISRACWLLLGHSN